MVSGQEDDGDVERLPHTEGKRLDTFFGEAFVVTVCLLIGCCKTSCLIDLSFYIFSPQTDILVC